ncbi:MAG TPA: hypothetical protein VE263_16330 [Candidatus Angelobacter sp.]|nr:hypothetical protein [Candidatus Angelobacter sp.]
MKSRRRFLTAWLAVGVPVMFVSAAAMPQRPVPPPPRPAQPGKEKDEDDSSPKFDSKSALEANKKDIKKDVERLFQLASELKEEVEKTDSVQVLSVAMLKKTEEIEKLAKGIRSRAIG